MNKKFILTVLAFVLSLTSWAETKINGINYLLDSDNKTASVTSSDDKYSGEVVIPSTVSYEGVTYSVTSIGYHAFSYCSGLISVTIPNSVTSIGESAFYYCYSLTSIEIPNSVTSIGYYAFCDCSSLTSVTIPNSVTSIDYSVFYGCSSLTSIAVDAGNPVYDSRENCNAIIKTSSNKLIVGCKNSTIPNSVTSIEYNAFEGCTGLTSITIPNSVTIIGQYAFYDCSNLTSITIPNSVRSIGDDAFSGCSSLTSIAIPNSVTSIGEGAFSSCSSLTSITVDAGNSVYDSRENCNAIIKTSSNTLISGCNNSTIPNSVTSIGYNAFCGCSGLTSISIPNSVTSIEYKAFNDCNSLADIYALRSDPSQYGCDKYAFIFNTSTCTLHVPTGCKEAYASTEPWSYFTNIVEEVLSGIKEMEVKSHGAAAYYNLNGQRITQLQRGINIVRYKDGTSRKILVK